jgi:Flp pilus assembly protein TadD
MRPLNALFRNGLISAIGLLIIFAIAQTSQAEYNNPSVAEKGTVAYWMDRGGMLSTYGNFLGAVQAYGKALTLDPQNAEAYFDTGLAQGQMGAYDQGLASIDKAISLRPDEGRYHYGRAWLMMRSGRADEAQAYFSKAVKLGSQDAANYMKRQMSGQ